MLRVTLTHRPLTSIYHTCFSFPQRYTRAMSGEQPNLHKDPVTGEMISKSLATCIFVITACLLTCHRISELKRRNEHRAKEARKAEKAAKSAQSATTTQGAAAGSTTQNEEELSPNVCYIPHLLSGFAIVLFYLICSNILSFARVKYRSFARHEIQILSPINSMSQDQYLSTYGNMARRVWLAQGRRRRV